MLPVSSDQLARLLVRVYDQGARGAALDKYYPAPVAREALRKALDWKRES